MKRIIKRLENKESSRESLILTISIVGCIVLVALGVFAINKMEEQKLLDNSPLAETHYWYSLDNYPKYKLEAAEMVEEEMESGLSKEEACNNAINATSDKIYADIVEFTNENPDIAPEDWDAELEKFIAKTQR